MKLNRFFSLLFISILLLAIQACSFSPCSNKEGFLEHSGEFFKSYNDNYKEINDAKRSKYEQEFNEIVENCYKKFKEDLSLKERQVFWKDAFLFLAKNNSKSTEQGFSFDSDDFNLSPYVEAELEEVIKDSGEGFAESLESLIETELPKVIDKVVDEIGKLGEELKKALENMEINIETENEGRQ